MSNHYGNVSATKITYLDGLPATLHLRRVRLVCHPNQPHATEHTFEQGVITLGTLEDNDICLTEDDTVSRMHCRILQEDEEYILVDLGSTNGTYINGVRIREAFLTPGCIIGVGNTQISFHAYNEQIPIKPSEAENFGGIVGQSVKMRELFGILEKICKTNATVVIEGETGTGKEVVAQAIHTMSNRADKPFVVFDCGAVPANLIESELFGHEKGSFTGAMMTRKGLFEMAQGGTIFLDELGELDLELQPKLLRVLEQREVRRVGSNTPIPIQVRVIAATNRKLEEEVKEGKFREDLFYRLSVVRLFLPPLRERLKDIPLLIQHILRTQAFNQTEGEDATQTRRIEGIDRSALDALMRYGWPGNVRELVNVIERASFMTTGHTIQVQDLPQDLLEAKAHSAAISAPEESAQEDRWSQVPGRQQLQEMPFKAAKEEWIATFERDYIAELLGRHGGNISKASREAEIDRKYFRKLMDKYDIHLPSDPL